MPRGCELFWLTVNCPFAPLYEYGKTESPVVGVPLSVRRVWPERRKSIGSAGTGKKGRGVPLADVTCALTMRLRRPVTESILKAVTSPQRVIEGPSAREQEALEGEFLSRT